MRLKRIEAVRYGELRPDTSLGDLGPELTVVFGPNESGKTTFTSLVRHVLFGFPDRRVTSERLYFPPNGDKRAGRLVFADGDEEWSVCRFDGPHGGTVEDPQGWLPRVTAGVTGNMYRGILGFGLDELADSGTLEELQQRLYATAAGLRVDPQEVREALRERADALWSPQARTRVVHQLNTQLRGVREAIREGERTAEAYRDERAELDGLTAESDRLTEVSRVSRLRAGKLAGLASRTRDLERQLHEDAEETEALRCSLEETQAEVDELAVDEGLLAQGAELEDLAGRAQLVQEAVIRAEKARERARGAYAEVDEALQALGPGWDADRIARVPAQLGVEAGIDEAEERLREAERQLDESARFADDARADAGRLHEEMKSLAQRAGLTVGDPEVVAAVRLRAVETLQRDANAGPLTLLPVALAAGAAVLIVVLGAVLKSTELMIAAVLPLALALYLAFFGRHKGSARARLLAEAGETSADPERLYALEQDLRRYLQVASQAWDVDGRRAVLEGKAEEGARSAEKALASWDDWLHERGLDGVGGPIAARAALREVRRAQQALRDGAQADAEEAAAMQSCREFSEAARAAGVPSERRGDPLAMVASVRTAREALVETRADRARQDALEAERRGKLAEFERLQERSRRMAEQLAALRQEAELAEDATLADLEGLASVAQQDADRDEEAARDAVQRRATLEGRLDVVAGDDAAARLRLEEAGLVERLGQALETWAVAAMAGALMDETLAEYERDRQPEIIRRACALFEYMTNGRYPKLTTPLGSLTITVQDGSSRTKEASFLSRGTAEQLYLALRLAYIDSLRDAHPALPLLMDDVLVNFDDEGRQAAAAKTIAAFAAKRQIVFFTCHKRVAELFAKAAPDHVRLTIERC